MDENGKPVINSIVEPSSSITVSAPDSSAFETGVWYYIITLPVTFSQGVTFTMSGDNMTGEKVISSTFSLKQGSISTSTNMDKNVAYQYHYKTPEMEDLGLSVKWGDRNFGASSSTDAGAWIAFPFATKVLNMYSSKPSYDVVKDCTGNTWRMPTSEEFQELIDQCTWTEETVNGVKGYRISRNGASIFLPLCGLRQQGISKAYENNNMAWYWTWSLKSGDLGTYGPLRYVQDGSHGDFGAIDMTSIDYIMLHVIRPVTDQ